MPHYLENNLNIWKKSNFMGSNVCNWNVTVKKFEISGPTTNDDGICGEKIGSFLPLKYRYSKII